MRYTPNADPKAETAALTRKGSDLLADDLAEPVDPNAAWRDGYRTGLRNAVAACIEANHYEAARLLSTLLVKCRA